MVTLKEVAKRANVSVATVSNVLNGNFSQVGFETKEHVLRVIQEMNYRPNKIAKSLRTSRTQTIGVIIEDITVFSAPDIIDGIGSYVEDHGYNIILNNLRLHRKVGNHYADIDKFRAGITTLNEVILSSDHDGAIYVGAHYRDVTNIIGHVDKPIVYTYCYSNDKNSSWINFNDEGASFDVTEYLIGYGHKRIAIITGMLDSIPCQERLKGYQRAILDHQLFINPGYIRVGDWEFESGYRQAIALLSEPNPPTAIVAMNDNMAGGVLKAAIERGLQIPRDLSLVGFDNREFSHFYVPSLTTVEIPLQEMGKMAAETLIQRLGNPRYIPENIKLDCRIVPRETVAAPLMA